jgi:hypothetical protein
MSENCFEPVGKGGWPPISIWIIPAPRGEVSSQNDTGTAEAPVSCGKNEALPRETYRPTTNPHYLEQSYGSNSEAPTCTR